MENTNFTLKSPLQTTDSKQNKERNLAKAYAFTSSFTPNLHHRHTSPEQNDFEEERVLVVPSASSSGLCRLLLAQTSTTTHTGAEQFRRRRVRRSLETNRSRREPRSKGLFFMIFPFPQFGFRIGCSDFLFASSKSFKFWAFPFLWEQRVGFDMIWGLFGFWIRDVWLIWLS